MTRQLVAGVLEIQLRQLRENGMEAHQVYADVSQMREHLDVLVEQEMAGVIEVLAGAQSGSPAEQEKAVLEARRISRQIVVALLVERQNLLRRLKIAEIAAQVRRLIGLETALLRTTEGLPAETRARRESLLLRAIEDHLDAAALYGRLRATLEEIRVWPGSAGSEAAEGLRKLDAGQVDQHVRQAEEHLRASRFPDAGESQRAVIRGLESLLEQIERAQGLSPADRRAAEAAIRQILDRQERLRQESERADLAQPEAEKLVEGQNELGKRIAELGRRPNTPEAAGRALKQAADSAQEAATQLFQQNRDAAVQQQERVIRSLEEAARRAQADGNESPAPASSQALEPALRDLQQARDELQAVRKEQERVSAAAADKPAEARQLQEKVAKDLARVPQGRRLPPKLTARVEEARQAAADAAPKMDYHAEVRADAARKAEPAVERALAEAEAALGEAKRDHLAARQSELEREAGRLEGAAAEKADPRAKKRAADARAQRDRAAKELAQLNQEARKTVAEARQAVEKELAEQLDSPGKRLQRLAEAREKAPPAEAERMAESERRLAKEALPQFGAQSRRADQLVDRAIPADPGATEALQGAENAARHAARQAPPTPGQTIEADRRIQAAREQAAASLAARQQRLARSAAEQAAATAQRAQAQAEAAKKPQRGDSRQKPAPSGPRPAQSDARGPTAPESTQRPEPQALREDPWFAKLPPEVRSAIRANAQRSPPRGYEERLRKYFQNIE